MVRTSNLTKRPKYVGRVYGRNKDGGKYEGTGFLLDPDGHIATCRHVVKTAGEIWFKLPYMKRWRCKDLALVEEEDVAVLVPKVRPADEPLYYARLHPEWFDADRMGTNVEVFGYSGDRNTDFTIQKQSTISTSYNEHGLFVLGRQLPHGDSGGPVLNEAGHVIGIVTLSNREDDIAMMTPISRLCELLKRNGLSFTGWEATGDLAEQAIDSLPDLMSKLPVRKAVKSYGKVFEKSNQHVSTLHAYKKAHELLYGVEVGCYNKLVSDARHFPNKKEARDHIFSHLAVLGEYVSDAERIFSYVTGDHPIATMRDQLKTAYAELENAHKKQDVTHCKAALHLLQGLVSWTLATFNTLLNTRAKELDIDSLVAALQGVQDAISSAKLPPETVTEFQLGVNELDTLGRELHRLTSEHDQWQQLDDVLRRINRHSPRLLSQIEIHWPMISSTVKAVCSVSPDLGDLPVAIGSNWRTVIQREIASLDNARTSGNSKKARYHFANLRHHAAARFDSTDSNLLETCGKISKVKDPLRTLVDNL
ncbi:MAG TPA: serine protease [Pyrinomonadaceae bacterium]